MMDRRRFLLISLAGAVATPLAAEAQQAAKVYRIGVLGDKAADSNEILVWQMLREGLLNRPGFPGGSRP